MCMQPREDQGQGNTTRGCRTVLNNIKLINREVEGEDILEEPPTLHLALPAW